MNVQLYENKGDLYVCIKNAPKGTKEKLEELFSEAVLMQLKGLVKENEEEINIPEDAKKIEVEKGDNLPFQKKTKANKKEEVKEEANKEAADDGFEDASEDDIPFEGGEVVEGYVPNDNASDNASEDDYDPFA